VINKETIPNGKFCNKRRKYSLTEVPNNPGLIRRIPNQLEVKLIIIPETTSSVVFLGII